MSRMFTSPLTQKSQNQPTWAHGSPRSLNQQPESLHGIDLGPLLICHSCVSWYTCGTPNTGCRGCLLLFCLLLAPYSSHCVALPSLNTRELISLSATLYGMFCWYLWEGCAFLIRKRGLRRLVVGKK